MMETGLINKEELLTLLEKMDKQLEKLDCTIVKNINDEHHEWLIEHEAKIDFCGKQLDLLDRKITSIKEHSELNQSSSIRFKFSY